MANPDETVDIEGEDQEESKKSKIIKIIVWSIVNFIFIGYFIYATIYFINEQNNCPKNKEIHKGRDLCGIQWCNGYGFLLIMVIFIYVGVLYFIVFKRLILPHLPEKCVNPMGGFWENKSDTSKRIFNITCYGILILICIVIVVLATYKKPSKLISLIAPTCFITCGYIFSYDRKAIKWGVVIPGIAIQFYLAVICMRWTVGRRVLRCIGDKVADFLFFTNAGSRFVFSDNLIDSFVFAFCVLTVIFFFSFVISILYYLNIMQVVIFKIGWLLSILIGTTACESVNAAANIFLGMCESPLLIRPYIDLLTPSELHAIMVAGFATVSGTVMAAYLSFGAKAAHLITASVMAAPGALALSKLYMPETQESLTTASNIKSLKSEDANILDAATNGATNAIPIVLGIVANIVAFIAFIAFLNAVVRNSGFLIGYEGLDFEYIFSKLFIPIVWAMGIPTQDCNDIALVVSTKTIINEFVAFQRLGAFAKEGHLESRSICLATFCICGFANPGSLGILIGSLSAMAPSRRTDITSVAIRAFFVGNFVSFQSASFAGVLMQEDDFLKEVDEELQ